jgi:hypothetical protein
LKKDLCLWGAKILMLHVVVAYMVAVSWHCCAGSHLNCE